MRQSRGGAKKAILFAAAKEARGGEASLSVAHALNNICIP